MKEDKYEQMAAWGGVGGQVLWEINIAPFCEKLFLEEEKLG